MSALTAAGNAAPPGKKQNVRSGEVHYAMRVSAGARNRAVIPSGLFGKQG